MSLHNRTAFLEKVAHQPTSFWYFLSVCVIYNKIQKVIFPSRFFIHHISQGITDQLDIQLTMNYRHWLWGNLTQMSSLFISVLFLNFFKGICKGRLSYKMSSCIFTLMPGTGCDYLVYIKSMKTSQNSKILFIYPPPL